MLAIEVNGEFLDLQETKVRLKLPSQVFTREFVAQGYSYPFTIQDTPHNDRLLGHISRIASTASIQPIVGRLWLGGMPWRPCELVFRGYKAGAFDMDLRTPEDQLLLDLKGKYLQDFVYSGPMDLSPGGFTVADMDQVYHDRTGTIDDTPFIFAPVRNTRRFGGRAEAYLNTDPDETFYDMNVPDDYVNYYNAVQTYDWLYYTNDPDIQAFFHEMSPFFYLAYICEQMAQELGYTITGDVLNDAEVRRQVIACNTHLGLLIETQGGLTLAVTTDGYQSLPVGNALPRMTVYSFWTKLMKRYCAVLTVRNGRMSFRSMNDILASSSYLDLTPYTEPGGEFEINEQDGYELSSIKESMEKLNEQPPKPTLILSSVNDYADLAALSPTVGDLAFVRNENAYYQYNIGNAAINVWTIFSHNLYSLQSGAMALKQDVGVVFTKMWRGLDSLNTSRSWLIPYFDQGMSDAQADWHVIGDNRVTELRLLFYRGLQEDSEGETYPFLTNGVHDYTGNTISGAIQTERLDGDGGIYDTWYRRWLNFLANSRVSTRKVRMPLHELIAFDFTRKVRIENITYLVKSIDVEVTNTSMGVATIELVKL